MPDGGGSGPVNDLSTEVLMSGLRELCQNFSRDELIDIITGDDSSGDQRIVLARSMSEAVNKR